MERQSDPEDAPPAAAHRLIVLQPNQVTDGDDLAKWAEALAWFYSLS